jgi:hypothetical protein
MRNRLGNFLLLCGLVCLVIFFSSSSFELDYLIYLFGGIGLISLGFLLKRTAHKRKRGFWRKKEAQDDEDQE